MSISMEYYCSRLEALLGLIFRLILLPIRCFETTNNRVSQSSNKTDILRKAVKDSLRISTYSGLKANGEAKEAANCAVCLCDVHGRDRVWELRNCNHVFHKGCLDEWLDHDEHFTCPLCRAPLMSYPQMTQGSHLPVAEPSWAVERLLYLFGDDLLCC